MSRVTSRDIPDKLVIEPMREGDIPQVLEIEREAFSAAWSEGAYRRELRWNRLARYLVLKEKPDVAQVSGAGDVPRNGGLGARLFSFLKRNPPATTSNNLVRGYTGQWLMVDESHLLTIALHHELRRRGLGEALLIAAIDQAVEAGARIMTLEVRVSNLAAQAMYEKFGFWRVGLRPKYYTDNDEDAVIMTSDILASASFQSRLQRLKEESQRKVGVLWSR